MSDSFNAAFGNRLRLVRHALGLSEEEAAKAYGRTLKTYQRYEAGAPQRGTHHKLVGFAARYNVSLDWLFEGSGKPFRGGAAPQGKIMILPKRRNAQTA
jgi:transcriptional regulator with XRE-family HTH domain